MRRILDWMVFQLERLLLRGAHYRLIVMALGVVLVAGAGGVGLVALGEPEGLTDATWWAFLRLTDPGYLGDDQGVGRRALSTTLTVLGYVLFMGALIAILTQWLHSTVAWLQRGETALVLRDHLVVLGLTERTPVVIGELLRSESRLRRVLQLGRRNKLIVVVLVDQLDEDLRQRLATDLGPIWDDERIILRSGSPLVEEHLERVDFSNAAAILIPGADDPGATAAERDALTLKTVLSIARHPQTREKARPPRLIAEIADDRLVDVVRAAYHGVLVLLPTDAIVGRLITQNLRHRGLSWVLGELLAFHSGNDLYFPEMPELVGLPFEDAVLGIHGGVCIGLVRPGPGGARIPALNPPRGTEIRSGDCLVVVARSRESIRSSGRVPAPPMVAKPPRITESWPSLRRVLVLGWGPRTRLILEELETYGHERFEVDVLSVISGADREEELARSGVTLSRVVVRHLVGDYVNVQDIRALDLGSYHNVVILGRGWLEGGARADAHTILCALIVRAELAALAKRPSLLVEVMDPDNATLFDEHPGEVVLSPEVMGRMMAHVAVRPEMHAVLDELFTVGGAELHYRAAEHYGLEGRTLTFSEIQQAALARAELAIGVRVSDAELDVRGDLELAPPGSARFTLAPGALILVLTTYDA